MGLFALLYVPAGHDRQSSDEIAPLLGLNVPVGQDRHPSSSFGYSPATQAEQEAMPGELKVPGEQAEAAGANREREVGR